MVTLHQERFRHEGQVMRRSYCPRGNQPAKGNWKINRSSSPICEVWWQRWHSTVIEPRSTSGFSDVWRALCDPALAPEYRACLPTGSGIVVLPAGCDDWPPAGCDPPPDGTQNNARLPNGSDRSRFESTTMPSA
jgi:hypothetical protein